MRTVGLLLAGGRGSRMGLPIPKPLLEIAGRTMADRVLDRLRAHVDEILVSTDDPEAFASLGCRTVQDRVGGYAGPLAGLDAAFGYLDDAGGSFRVLCVPADTPFLPVDLAPRLLQAGKGDELVVAEFVGRLQPATTLWPRVVLQEIGARLGAPDAPRSLLSQITRFPHRIVPFTADAAAPNGDPFFNVNTPDDYELALVSAKSVE